MKKLSVGFLLTVLSCSLSGQDDLMNLLNENALPQVNYSTATFKSTRIMNGHSIENMPAGQFDFRISHRFGRINTGAYEFFGLDQANIRLGLEYGISKWMMVGIGRGSYEKAFDGYSKFILVRQSSGAVIMPVAVSLFSSVAFRTMKDPGETTLDDLSSRVSYTGQLLIARKFNQTLSLQLTPSYVRRNLEATEADPSPKNDLFAMGVGGRIKLTKIITFNAEYFYAVNNKAHQGQPVYNPLSLGFDIQTGGHVFQLICTNSVAMIEKGFIGETTGKWGKGDIHFGFNISRVFTVKKHQNK